VVQSKTQERVVEIIDAGDRGEHPLNRLFTGLARPGRDGERGRRGVGPLLNGWCIYLHHESVVAPAFRVCQGDQVRML
jgi:hypothetical protein